jgi:hypothetical protein
MVVAGAGVGVAAILAFVLLENMNRASAKQTRRRWGSGPMDNSDGHW